MEDEFSVTFSKFDDAVNLVRKLRKGARMAKLDVKHAFIELFQWIPKLGPAGRVLEWLLLC